MEIPSIKWEKQRKLELDKGFRDALRDYVKRRWPHHTAKYAARAFDLTLDQGRAVANGSPSLTTVERALKNGGVEVAVPIIEEVIGVNLSGFFRQALLNASEAEHHEQLATAAWARLARDPDAPGDDGAGASPTREARSFPGEVGADAPRRLGGDR